MSQEPGPGVRESFADQALGKPVRGVQRRGQLARVDGPAGDAPAKHGIARRHPPRLFGEALTCGAVQHRLGVEVERGRSGRCHDDPQLGQQEERGEEILVGQGGHAKLRGAGAVVPLWGRRAAPGNDATSMVRRRAGARLDPGRGCRREPTGCQDETPVAGAVLRVAVGGVDVACEEVQIRRPLGGADEGRSRELQVHPDFADQALGEPVQGAPRRRFDTQPA